jgi:hypothetical protein
MEISRTSSANLRDMLRVTGANKMLSWSRSALAPERRSEFGLLVKLTTKSLAYAMQNLEKVFSIKDHVNTAIYCGGKPRVMIKPFQRFCN